MVREGALIISYRGGCIEAGMVIGSHARRRSIWRICHYHGVLAHRAWRITSTSTRPPPLFGSESININFHQLIKAMLRRIEMQKKYLKSAK